MTDRDRQRRLHVANRLEELNAKYGAVDDDLPDWLDHMPEPPPATPPQNRATEAVSPRAPAASTEETSAPRAPARPRVARSAQGRPADW